MQHLNADIKKQDFMQRAEIDKLKQMLQSLDNTMTEKVDTLVDKCNEIVEMMEGKKARAAKSK